MSLSRRTFLIAPGLMAAACPAWAQEPSFSASVDLVSLLATVRNRDGAIVKDLAQEDFLLEEAAIPQTIRYFSRESDLPLTVGLLVDTSQSQEHVLEAERRATLTFLDRVLREGVDQAFIAHFDVRVEVLQSFNSSRTDLASALARLKVPKALATLLYDAVRECSENLMKSKAGRKAFILLCDGVDFRSKTSLTDAIEYAQRADTIVYSIFFAERLAGETGGAFFEVTKDNPIETVYSNIEDALRNQYSIAYTPEPPAPARQYRKIRLTTKQPGLKVQTRDGYYSR